MLSVGELTGTVVAATISLVIIGYLAAPVIDDLTADATDSTEAGPLNGYKGLLQAVVIIMVVMVIAGIAYGLYRKNRFRTIATNPLVAISSTSDAGPTGENTGPGEPVPIPDLQP